MGDSIRGQGTTAPDTAALTRIADLRGEVEAALASLQAAAEAGEDASEVAGVLEDLRRRARRWRLTNARVRAAAPALLAALRDSDVPARDPRTWIDTDEHVFIVLASVPGRDVLPEALDDASKRIAGVLGVESAAVRVTDPMALPGGLREEAWLDGESLEHPR